jgi:hypothetical protein
MWTRQDIVAYSRRRKSGFLAGLLSLMPGLGQVYVGYYQRGFVHAVVVFATIGMIVAVADTGLDAILGPFLGFFWLYNIIDAVRLAGLYNEALAGTSPEEFRERLKPPALGGSLFGGVVLVIVGFLMFLHTAFDISLDWLEHWWPLAPIALGGYLIYRGVQERKESPGP